MSDRARIAPFGTAGIDEQTSPAVHFETLLAVSAEPERKTALAALRERGSLDVPELAGRVVAREQDRSPEEVGEAERRRASTALHHSHLPRLEEAGLVELDRNDDDAVSVRPSDVGTAALETLDEFADHERVEDVLSVLSDPDRRQVAAAIERADDPVSISSLARAIADESDVAVEPDAASVESAKIALHHVHLPTLADAGLIEYDPEEGRVESADFPEPLSDLLGD